MKKVIILRMLRGIEDDIRFDVVFSRPRIGRYTLLASINGLRIRTETIRRTERRSGTVEWEILRKAGKGRKGNDKTKYSFANLTSTFSLEIFNH